MTKAMATGVPRGFLRQAWAGAAATASGNGLARFAFVPLFPAMVSAGWVDGAEAGALGALTLLGALIGTLGARQVALRLPLPHLLDLGMGVILLSLAACSWNGGLWWLMPWRLLAGVGGGILMALAGPAAAAAAPPERRGTAGGIVVAGVGLGIAGGALAVPAFLTVGGVAAGWAGLAALVGLLWVAARRSWPLATPDRAGGGAIAGGKLLLAVYGLHSAGMLPPMVYLADLAVRGHHLPLQIGSLLWFAFGICGVGGGMLAGRLADRFGSRAALTAMLVAQASALALCLQPLTALIVPAAALAGVAAVGTTTVILTLVQELAGPQATLLWVRCTAVYAVTQAAVGFLLAGVFGATGESHFAVFAIGAGLSLAALVSARRI